MFGRGFKALFVLLALLTGTPVALCAPQQSGSDCCQGEQRAPCNLPDPRPATAPAPKDCCIAAPDAPIASAFWAPVRLERAHALAGGSAPVFVSTSLPSIADAVEGTAPESLDAFRRAFGSRDLYLLTRRLRL